MSGQRCFTTRKFRRLFEFEKTQCNQSIDRGMMKEMTIYTSFIWFLLQALPPFFSFLFLVRKPFDPWCINLLIVELKS